MSDALALRGRPDSAWPPRSRACSDGRQAAPARHRQLRHLADTPAAPWMPARPEPSQPGTREADPFGSDERSANVELDLDVITKWDITRVTLI